MDPISTAASCLSVIQSAIKLHDELKENYQDCRRLLQRCIVFQPTLLKIQTNPSMYQPTSEPAYQRLLNNLQEAVKFGRRFQEPTFYRSVVRVAFRKTYAEELAKLNLAITESATDLDLVQGMDFEQRRREDIEVSLPACLCSAPALAAR